MSMRTGKENRVNELKPLTCPNCGGRINAARMRCEYCGTQFKREEGPVLRIETARPGVRTLEANVRIPEYYIRDFNGEEVGNIVRDQISRKLAEALVPMLDVKTGHDLERMEAVMYGRIRVLEPGYRF